MKFLHTWGLCLPENSPTWHSCQFNVSPLELRSRGETLIRQDCQVGEYSGSHSPLVQKFFSITLVGGLYIACLYRFSPAAGRQVLFREQRDNVFICVRYYLKSENCVLTLVVGCDQRITGRVWKYALVDEWACGLWSMILLNDECKNTIFTLYK